MTTLKGFKAFDKDFTCLGFKYEVGKTYEMPESETKLCKSGFHFCINAQDCINYYSKPDCFAEVEAVGKWVTDGDKTVTNKIRIIREVSIQELQIIANSGSNNTGYRNSGDYNSGHYNSGHYNSGHYNSGNRNSGHYNSGHRNSGHYNSGDYNSGDYNSGNRNSGDYNSGDYNSGHYNSGHRNSGHYNSGDYNSGFFNSNEPNLRMFNKDSNIKRSGFSHKALSIISSNFCDRFNVWVSSERMTDEEKNKHKYHKTTGGFIRKATYKEAWGLMWENLNPEQKECFKTLPNFDEAIFFEITGCKF